MTTTSELAAGAGPTIDFDGRRMTLLPWDLDDFAAARAHLREILPDPMASLQGLINTLHPEVQKAVALQAYEDRKNLGTLSTTAAKEYFMTTKGLAFFLHRSLMKSEPGLRFEEVEAWVVKTQRSAILDTMQKLQRASGLDDGATGPDVKNSPSRPSTRERSTGSTSTGPSPNVTRGRRRKR